uniref:feline leukemia virus subgroup C receptor-related protein 2-like isoform X2 n=1 Tax=Styela clava TaxID=7725 RepID=UPI00193A3C9C|nr:feline leukemia virus subgroup C receptor-related protein 2-like isoform X2 [Styela clava]
MMSSTESDGLIFVEETKEQDRLLNNKTNTIVRNSSSRWFMLFMGSAIGLINGIQNLQFAGFESTAVAFFEVSYVLGDLLTQAYYISFIAFGFPVIWLIMRYGLRFTVQCAATLIFIGTAMTAISTSNRNFFFVALTSEFIAGCAQVFVLCLPSLLAGKWFPTNEISTASGTLVFFYQLGNGLSLLTAPLVVTKEFLGATLGMRAIVTFISISIFSFVMFIMIRLYFAEKPEFPPSEAQATFSTPNTSFAKSLKNLFTDGDFVLLMFSYGIDFGIFSSVQSLFKSVIEDNFTGISDATTGQIVSFMILVGTPAPLVFGIILDKTKRFKFGFTGKMSVGLETAAEMTYPEPEGTSSGILVWAMSLFTTIFIQVMRYLLTLSNVYVNVFIASCSVVAFIFTCFMQPDLRRTRANYEIIEDSDHK